MEFIPGAQNITQVLNRGLASEEWVLSPANTLGLPYWGQATERLNIACNRQTAWGVECFKGEVAYRVMYVFFFFLLYTVQVIVLVCHYKRKALPLYNGFPAYLLTVH